MRNSYNSARRRVLLALSGLPLGIMANGIMADGLVIKDLVIEDQETHANSSYKDQLQIIIHGLTDSIHDRESAKTVGKVYLTEYPHEADPGRLISLILKQNKAIGQSGDAGIQSLPGLTRPAIQHDFKHRNTVAVNGWRLSRTEARLYALTCFA